MKKIFFIALLMVQAVSLPLCFAQGFGSIYEEDFDQEKTLMIGEVYILPSEGPIRVSVRNPEILDVSKVTEKEVIVVAKKAGDTAITVWNKDGQKTVFVTVFADDLEMIKKRLERLIHGTLKIPEIEIKKNETTGKIILMGEVLPPYKEQIDKVVDPFHAKIDNLVRIRKESKMVQIEARILELNKTELDRLGIKWQESMQINEGTVLDTEEERSIKVGWPWGKFWSGQVWTRTAVIATINTLISDGKGRELSRPKLLCLSGEESKLVVGGEVPYVSGSTTGTAGTSVSINYKEYGVIFKLRPTVLPDGKIFLNIGTEVSEIDWTNAIIISGIRVPAFLKRTADTVANLSSGETIFIAGLIKSKETENIDKFPALGEVPVLGSLFKSKDFRNNQSELVVTLTSEIVESKGSAELPAVKEPKGDLYRSIMSVSENNTIPRQLQGYVLRVQRKITDNMSYPLTLLNTGWEGVVMLRLNLDKNGDLKDAQITKSSGYKIFDEDALRLVKSLSYPSFPAEVSVEELKIEVPIAYRENR